MPDKLIRVRKQPTAEHNPWNFDLEVGDRVYIWIEYEKTATMMDLVESRGWGKAAGGVLTPKPVRKDGKLRVVVIREGIWYWV